jgi:hypothetical protein
VAEATQLIGLVAGLAAAVYIAGGVVMVLRLLLELRNVAVVGVVPHLPRELLISIGLTAAVFPFVLFASAYLLMRLLVRWDARRPSPTPLALATNRRRWQIVTRAAVIDVVLTIVLYGIAQVRGRFDELPIAERGAVLLAILVALGLSTTLAFDLRARLATRFNTTTSWNTPMAVGLSACCFAAPGLPFAMLASASAGLPRAQVCSRAPLELEGRLIAESRDRVYLGQPDDAEAKNDQRLIVSVPSSRIESVFIGPSAATATAGCTA